MVIKINRGDVFGLIGLTVISIPVVPAVLGGNPVALSFSFFLTA
jgi:hypothetical protein